MCVKLRITAIPALLLSALLTLSCGSDSSSAAFRFNKATADRQQHLTDEDQSPTCTVHLSLPYADTSAGGDAARKLNQAVQRRLLDMYDLTMQQAVDSFANIYTASYKQSVKALYQQDRNDPSRRTWYEYHYVCDGEARGGFPGVTVYLVTLDYYEGGAHGINQQLCMNFDEASGRQLLLPDIFTVGYERKLNGKLLQALQQKLEVKSLDEVHKKGYLYSMDMFAPENFILDAETITFIYNPYEIAPYEAGSVELVLSFSDLTDILMERFKK